MKPDLLRFLLVEDSDDDAELVLRALRTCANKIDYERVMTKPEMQKALDKGAWDLVISDFNMPFFSGFEAIETLKASKLDAPLILVSGTIGEASAVDAVKRGASDYVLKDNLGRLPTAVGNALRERNAAQENRLLLKQLEQAQKMESIGRLAGGLAHDINNVLGAISLYSEMGVRQLEDGKIEDAARTFKEILNAQESAAGIIRQLLMFSRNQFGNRIVLDFSSVVRNMEPLLRRLIGEHIELTIETPEDESIRVMAAPAQIEQIILNLVVNARDAMPAGGKLHFTLETRQLETLPADVRIPRNGGGFAVLTAKDSGCGMAPEIVQQIFEPFFSTKEVGRGTGLGLSVIYGILEREKGTVAVESTLMKGTTFRIYWPLDGTPLPLPSIAPPAKAISGSSAHILLAEDEELLRRPLAKTLRDQGFQVHEAANGAEALKLLTGGAVKIDLLVTDAVMPQMGGLELIEKSRLVFPELKVLMLSGYTNTSAENLDPALTWFLGKPFSKNSLLTKINELLAEPSPKKDAK